MTENARVTTMGDPHDPERGHADRHRAPASRPSEAQVSGRRDGGEGPPFWEWVVAAFGAAALIGGAGFLLFQALYGDPSPPDIVVQVDSVARTRTGYVVTVVVKNHGGTTAAELTLVGELGGGTADRETSSVTLRYVPPHSRRRAGLFFTRDPRTHPLRLRPTGYEEP